MLSCKVGVHGNGNPNIYIFFLANGISWKTWPI